MRYIKEEYDYISSIRRNNILFDMALYKLDQMIAEMKFNHTYDRAADKSADKTYRQV